MRTAMLALLVLATPALAIPPVPDHIVIVFEENRSVEQIIGSPDAPYINSLASNGASFTNMYALTHPSQPNYIHFFSGSNQGVFDNNVPIMLLPFTAPNLGAGLLNVGRTFVGYCEGLPSVGYNGSSNGNYQRLRNPWSNWQGDPPGPNQIPSVLNKPFFTTDGSTQPFYGAANAPTDYSGLPNVSIVVPNRLNDMRDGTLEMADDWLFAHIKPFADWAMINNSLLVLTWDEAGGSARNRIPTILVGPMIVPGQYSQIWTHHNLLRTMSELYEAAPAGSAANVRSIVGCFNTDPPIATKSFRQNVGGYLGAKDTFLWPAGAGTNYGASSILYADNDPLPPAQILMRFDDIVGEGAIQVPQGATVLSSKLLMLTGPSSATFDSSVDRMEVHRMLAPWADSSTWLSMINGVSLDDSEAASAMEFDVIPNVLDAWAIFDVSESVQLIVNNPGLNNGWLVHPTGSDGWRCQSSEAAEGSRPLLEISYDPTSCRATIDQQPMPVHAVAGAPVVLSVSASNPNPISYRWRKAGFDLFDGGDLSGTATATFTIDPADAADTGSYDVVVSNACGDVPSLAVSVLVCPAAPNGDLNSDTLVNGLDIATFVDATLANSSLAAHLCPGDFSLDNQMDLADMDPFIAVLVAP